MTDEAVTDEAATGETATDETVPAAEQAKQAWVVVASNRAAAGTYEDTTGPLIVEQLASWGYDVTGPLVVPDGQPVAGALTEAIAAHPHLIVTTGGTGVNPTDKTPEMTRPLLDAELPGIADAIRAFGVANGVPTAMLSRALAGVAQRSVVVNLPGSAGGVRDGLAVLGQIHGHVVDQVRGGDHRRSH